MSSPSVLYWIFRSKLVIPPFIVVKAAPQGVSPSLTKLGLEKGSSFQIHKVGRESGHLHAVAQGAKHILNKPKLSSNFLKLGSKVSAAVVIAAVSLDLGDDSPVIEVMGSFVEGVVGGCGASK
jgi:hypothetical protein